MINSDCKCCIHFDGLYGDPFCPHKQYCETCIRRSCMKDNYQASHTDERALYEQLKRKFGDK